MSTYVYVDGFNVYYGAVKGTPYKWLDLSRLCSLLLPGHEITAIKYYTALVNARPDDPGQPIRQHTYLRALRTTPNLSIYYGRFLNKTVRMPLANPGGREAQFVQVLQTEEKGSDVNLATHLALDASRRAFSTAVVISNDSDLVEPVRLVRSEFRLAVGVICPHRRVSRHLAEHASFVKKIRKGAMRESQFPRVLRDDRGTFHKPEAWE